MKSGWVSLHRKILDNPIFADSQLVHLFIYLLLKANHKPKEFLFNGSVIRVEKGSLITGLKQLSSALNIPQSTIYRKLNTLRKWNIIETKTENKFTLVVICKYSSYQVGYETNGKQMENKWKTNGKQMETNNNNNNVNNYNKEEHLAEKTPARDFIEIIIDCFKRHYLENKGVPYLSSGRGNQSSGKDRAAVGKLLRVVKNIYPDDNSEMMLERFNNLFNSCFQINDSWLVNNISLSLISSKLNEFIHHIKNGSATSGKGFDPAKNTWLKN